MAYRRWLALACLGWAGAAQAEWQEASSRHFVVYSDDDAEKVRAFATRLELADKAMRVLRGADDPPISPNSRVTVFVVPSTEEVAKLARDGGAAGFYVPRAAGPVAFVPRHGDGSGKGDLSAQQVLLHEYAHHFMYSSLGDAVVPAWLSEGFAEFNATAEFSPDGGVRVGQVPLYRAYGILNGGDLPVDTLLTADPNHMQPMMREMFYGRSWLLTHYFMTDEARRKTLAAYLGALTQGKPAKESARLLGTPMALNRQLGAYMRAPLLSFGIPAKLLPIQPVTVRSLTAAEAAVMPARITSSRGVDAKTARVTLARARKLAAPFPTDAAAQNELAEAELDAGNPAESAAAADRALAADSKSVHAMMYAGLARLALARNATPLDPKAFETARGWLRRANHLDPENPWPLEQYYFSYVAAKQTPTRNAEDGLLYARELAPYDPDLGMAAAYVYLRRDKADDARRLLQPIASNPHGGRASQAAQAILATLDKDGAGAAADKMQPAADATRPAGNPSDAAATERRLTPPVRPARSVRAR